MSPASRRGFLKGFAAFSAGSTAVVAAAASAAEPHPDAALLALGAEVDRTFAVFLEADAEHQRAIERFKLIEPPVPEGLALRMSNGLVHTESPPGPLGYASPGYWRNRTRIPCAYDLKRLVKQLDGRTVNGREARRLKRLLDAYTEAHAAAREAAGTNRTESERAHAGWRLAEAAEKVDEATASTLDGLAIKGRTALAWARRNRAEGGVRERDGVMRLYENLAALGGGASPGPIRPS